MEFGFGQGWFDRFAYDNSAFALTLLREMVVTMSARLARMREETLDDHKADRLEFVRRILAFAGLDKPARDPHRHTWSRIGPAIRVPSCTHLLMTATSQRLAWRVEYDRAMLAATVLPPEGRIVPIPARMPPTLWSKQTAMIWILARKDRQMSAEPSAHRPRRRVTTKVAAAHICVNPEVLRRWNRHRDPWLPRPRKVGKDFRCDLDALDAALDAQEDSGMIRRID
ncbi:hypothetical protein [Nocardia farcinica]|uniref:hypothetical protein n=1 Tax=Nocardia farcinica TaxID=37329 RepID=UPI002457AA41|nr:hypothetical protein [Nocardia farcinica]